MTTVSIDEARIGHIFRQADGHFEEDTAANRQNLIDVASRPSSLLGTDRFGNAWYAETLGDGRQVWVQVRGGRITNGGVNLTPRRLLGHLR
jgi:hypothetical protein